jgi:hypothetical protein
LRVFPLFLLGDAIGLQRLLPFFRQALHAKSSANHYIHVQCAVRGIYSGEPYLQTASFKSH